MDYIGFPKDLPEKFRPDFASLYNEVALLREEVNSLKRREFSHRSERYDIPDPLFPIGSLFNEPEKILLQEALIKEKSKEAVPSENSEKETSTQKPTPKKQGGKKPLSDKLPREVQIHDLPEEEKICKNDLTPLFAIGEDVVEKVDIVPMKVKVIQHRYLKYACPCCEQNIVRAKTLPSLIPGSIAESGLLAHIATNKYYFALPLYRQESIFKQNGFEIPRVTLARWMISVGESILPLVNEIKEYILSHNVVHCDETHVQVLKEESKKATSKSYMWVLASGMSALYPAVVFQYYSNRTQESAEHFLEYFNGYLQVDGYGGYNSISNRPGVTRVGCWSHARRKFDVAFKDGAPTGKVVSELFIKEIQKLFLLERDFVSLSSEERLLVRQEKSKPIIQNIRNLIDNYVTQITPRSKLGIAFGYISGEWPQLIQFLNHGSISLSNNRVENAIRPFAIGRNNWLFSYSTDGADASAAIYSLISTAKENKLHVEEYLNDVFTQLPLLNKQENPCYESLLPWNWAKNHPQHVVPGRK